MKIYDKIVLVDIEKIKPYWNNPRINDKTIEILKQAIQKFGFNVPLVVDKNYVIVKGHSRYHAAKQLGLKKLPVIISEKSDKENMADRVYDNKIQEYSKWDYEALAIELREFINEYKIEGIEFDIPYQDLNDLVDEKEDFDSNEGDSDFSNFEYKGIKDENSEKNEISKKNKIICPYCGKEFYI